MKKFVAIVLCIALIFALSVTASAKVVSPSVKVMIRKGIGVEVILSLDTWYDASGNVHVKVKADEADYGEFSSWSFYRSDGSNAVENVDYELVSSITSKTIEFICHSSVIVCANYNGKITDPLKPSNPETPDKPVRPDDKKSDKTGDVTIPVTATLLLAGAAFVFASKKVLGK